MFNGLQKNKKVFLIRKEAITNNEAIKIRLSLIKKLNSKFNISRILEETISGFKMLVTKKGTDAKVKNSKKNIKEFKNRINLNFNLSLLFNKKFKCIQLTQ